MLNRLLCDDEGVLTFEWILLLTLLVIGVIGGMAGIRDAMLHEAQGIVGAMVSLDQSYEVVPPLGVGVDSILPVGSGYTSSASYSAFRDSATWANGRLTPSELVNVAQTVYVSNNLGSVMPLP